MPQEGFSQGLHDLTAVWLFWLFRQREGLELPLLVVKVRVFLFLALLAFYYCYYSEAPGRLQGNVFLTAWTVGPAAFSRSSPLISFLEMHACRL